VISFAKNLGYKEPSALLIEASVDVVIGFSTVKPSNLILHYPSKFHSNKRQKQVLVKKYNEVRRNTDTILLLTEEVETGGPMHSLLVQQASTMNEGILPEELMKIRKIVKHLTTPLIHAVRALWAARGAILHPNRPSMSRLLIPTRRPQGSSSRAVPKEKPSHSMSGSGLDNRNASRCY
jgi:hypothetical protein